MVRAADKFSYVNVGGSDREFFEHIASYQGQEVCIGRVACHALEAVGAACRADLAVSEACSVVCDGLHVILREGDGGGAAHVVEVEPGVAWLEGDGACVMVND